jgi:ribosomal protein S18 acetylase RimI-like enzyme
VTPPPTTPEIRIEVADDPAPELALVVDSGLDRYNHESAPVAEVEKLAAFARAPSGEVVGGAVGRTWGRCCELLQLWVAHEHRDQGVGSRLVREFEARARTRGCDIFYLTTLSFQAPDFYRRHGYAVLAQIAGYPGGIVKYLMQKVDGEGAR